MHEIKCRLPVKQALAKFKPIRSRKIVATVFLANQRFSRCGAFRDDYLSLAKARDFEQQDVRRLYYIGYLFYVIFMGFFHGNHACFRRRLRSMYLAGTFNLYGENNNSQARTN